jgi:hypothetical protein
MRPIQPTEADTELDRTRAGRPVSDLQPPLVLGARRLFRYRYILLGFYALLLLAAVVAATALRLEPGAVVAPFFLLLALQAMFLAGAPHFRWPRPTGRRPMLLSVIAGSFMAGLLSIGVLATAVSFFQADDLVARFDELIGAGQHRYVLDVSLVVIVIVGLSWAVWLAVFALAWTGEWLVRFRRMYRLIFAGSWLELLITIPVDVQVRKRTKCYCGEGTFLALIVGITSAVWAFGPGLYLLFLTRRLQRRADLSLCRGCGYDLRGLVEPRCPECGRRFDAALLSAGRAPAEPIAKQ